ncbi:MAG: mevalonate kinase [Anaerolineales bacterium]
MPAISATAPGKIILFGEHAVVYGQPAIAVPVNQVKARAIISARPDQPRGWVNFQAPDIRLEKNWDDLPADHPLVLVVRGVLEATQIYQPPAMTIRVSSSIPIAAGLGSGAAVSVAMIRALSEFLGRPLLDEDISDLAFEIEKLYHGTPSGIDNTVITYEKPIFFTRKDTDQKGMMEPFQVSKPFTIVIGDSGIPSPTAAAVADVRKAWQEDSMLFQDLFNSTGKIVYQARQAIENGDIAVLGPLMNENQSLLEKMGISSIELDRLVQAARQAGANGAKLSGGGRGGNMIALVPKESAQQIAKALTAAGATNIIITTVNS